MNLLYKTITRKDLDEQQESESNNLNEPPATDFSDISMGNTA